MLSRPLSARAVARRWRLTGQERVRFCWCRHIHPLRETKVLERHLGIKCINVSAIAYGEKDRSSDISASEASAADGRHRRHR